MLATLPSLIGLVLNARPSAPALARAPAVQMVDIPRVTLPDAIASTFADLDLKNPNELSQAAYNTYSGAAIAGTLAFFLPGVLIFDVTGVIFDFLFSALLGGGVAAFAALAGVGPVNAVGAKLIDATGADVPRLTLPDALDGTFNDFDLKNPNTMTQDEYNAYSGAAIAGTLALFLPGALAIFDVSGFIGDFAFSALVGGGAAAYCSLRKDGIGDTANDIGGKLLGAIDKVVS